MLLLHERDLEREYYDNWRSGWVQSRKPVVRPTQQEIEREVEAWAQHEAGNDVPSGKVYRVDVMTTGSPEAAPVPEGFFNGDRDTRCSVIRE